jgi:hypothetical protein
MPAAAPPAPHTDRLPPLLQRFLLQLLPPLRQAAAAGAAKAAAATSEQSSLTGRQLVAYERENLMRQVSQRDSRTTALQYEQRPEQLQCHAVHERPRLGDAAAGRNVSSDRERA